MADQTKSLVYHTHPHLRLMEYLKSDAIRAPVTFVPAYFYLTYESYMGSHGHNLDANKLCNSSIFVNSNLAR
jgi:hypothetical protein